MATPIFDYITIIGLNGKLIRGRVVHVQPNALLWPAAHANIEIICDDINLVIEWIAGHRFQAIYTTPTQIATGFYVVHGYLQDGETLRILGTFELANHKDAPIP